MSCGMQFEETEWFCHIIIHTRLQTAFLVAGKGIRG